MPELITERAVLGMFYERLEQNAGASWVDPISTDPMKSDQDSESYPWLGQVPGLSARNGPKQYSELGTFDWTVANVEYQGGIKIPEKWILYDKTGQVQVRVNELADGASSHWAELIAPLITGGETGVCYDGQYFFDTDHVSGASGTQSNIVQVTVADIPATNKGTTSAPSAATMVYSVMKGIEKIVSFKDDQGRYCNENMTEFMIMVPHTMMIGAAAALGAQMIDGGDTNLIVAQDSFRLRFRATPRLSDWTTKFSLFALQGNQKAFIRQQRVPNNAGGGFDADGMRLQQLWLDSEHCKKNGECLMSVETERAAAYGDWKKAVQIQLQ